jgi:hypothetical protein
MLDMEREANTLSGLIPKVREYMHKFFALGKLKSAMLKKFRVTSSAHDGLTMNFTAISGEVCEFSCSEAVSFVTKDGTMNMFDSFLKGDCSFAPETVQNDKQLLAVYQLEIDTEAAVFAEYDRAKAADHAEGLAAYELHQSQMRMKKRSSTAATPSKAKLKSKTAAAHVAEAAQDSCHQLLRTSSVNLVNYDEVDEKEEMKEADKDDFLSSHSPSGSSSSSSHRKPNGSTGAPVVINGKNKKVSKRAAGSMGCSVSEHKRRSRDDLFKTLVHLTNSGSSSSDADSLIAVFDKAEE